jgi:polyisoprenyl-phosphate glycosyltransferase
MKKISIVVPCYNEDQNVIPISTAIIEQLEQLSTYDYELIFIDNCSTDKTRELLRGLCKQSPKIKAIFNVKNFGQFNSPYYGLCQATGDCAILICADFQDPVELIPVFVAEWEKGYQIVCGIKNSSKENRLIFFLRGIYYKMIQKMSSVAQIEHFTGFGLYDRTFLDILRSLNDASPFLRGIVAELGGKRKDISYVQAKRRAGKTHNNWYSLYDAAMLSFTSYTKIGLRLAVFLGGIVGVVCLLIGFVYLVMKLVFWDRFIAGQAPQMIGTFFLGSLQLFFIGLIGEYIMSMSTRVMHRPLVVEQERLNFNQESENP